MLYTSLISGKDGVNNTSCVYVGVQTLKFPFGFNSIWPLGYQQDIRSINREAICCREHCIVKLTDLTFVNYTFFAGHLVNPH